MFLRFFVLIAICWTADLQVQAQSKYYVSTSGSDLNAGTSLATPLATVAKALTKVTVPGDTIFVRSGTYTVSSTVSINKAGTSAKHYVLTVYKPDMVNANSRPIFDFSGMAAGSSNRGFNLSGANYWDIYGIVIKGAGDNGMNLNNSSFTKIEFCSFTRNRDTGLQIGGGSHDVKVINCDSFENADLGAGTTSGGGNADGFAPKLDVGDNVLFRGCRAWMNSDDGWDGYLRTGSPGTLDNMTTYLEDCWAFRNGYYWLDGTTTSEQNGNGFKTGGSDNKNEAHNFSMIKCLAFDNKAKGFDQNNNAGSIYVYNCSAFRNGGNDYGFNSSSVTYKTGAELVLKNNLSLGTKGVSLPASSSATRIYTASNNSFKTTTTSGEIISLDTAGVTGARSVDGSLPVLNFMRLNTSAATPYTYIDQGVVLSAVTYRDAAGVPYSGSAPDLGAFESGSVLPVRMVSFSASPKGLDVVLKWKTASEVNNYGWNIERADAENAGAWKTVGFVAAGGNSNSQKSYSYTDRLSAAGTYFYRLRQTDLNGAESLSEVVLVSCGIASSNEEIQVYPNPVTTSTKIAFSVSRDSKLHLKVLNALGQPVVSLAEEFKKTGLYEKNLDFSALPAGVYYIMLSVDEKVLSKTVVKQ